MRCRYGIEYTILDDVDDLEIFNSWGSLYKLVSPDNLNSAEKIGSALYGYFLHKHEILTKLGILDQLPPAYYIAIEEARRVVDYGMIQFKISETNPETPETCYSYIFVHPDFRRRGIGSAILEKMIEEGKKSAIKSIFFFAEDIIAEEFLVAKGGELSEEGCSYHKIIDTDTAVDIEHLDTYRTKFIEKPTSDQLHEFIEVYNKAKTIEPGNLSSLRSSLTPEEYLDYADNANTLIVAMIYKDDRVVGVTGFMLTDVEGKIFQKFTGVDPEFTGNNFGTILKAKVIMWLKKRFRDQLPITLETSTLDENLPMQRIFQKLGFEKNEQENVIEFDLK